MPTYKKINYFHLFILQTQLILESRDQIGQTHILIMPNQKIFKQLLKFVDLHQHAKNETVQSICSREIVNLKILQSDWLRAINLYQKRFFDPLLIHDNLYRHAKNQAISLICSGDTVD